MSGTGSSRTYTPVANYNGSDSFTFTANDGSLDSNVATFTITISPVNDVPVAYGQSVTTARDTAKPITLGGGDTETAPANLTFTIAMPPGHGTLSATAVPGSAPTVTYTPSTYYTGPDAFTFKATDRGDPDTCGAPVSGTCSGALTSAEATVAIMVTAAPLTITTPSLGDGFAGESFFGCLSSTGGTFPLTWGFVPGSHVPKGLDFSNNCFDTSPGHQLRETGTFTFTVQVKDSSVPRQTASRTYTINVYGIDQQVQSFGLGDATAIGDGTRISQGITVGATGSLMALQFPTLSCSTPVAANQVTIKIEGVVAATGAPDDSQVFATTTVPVRTPFQIIPLPALPAPLVFTAGSRFAIVLSTSGACTISNPSTFDNYLGGAAFVDSGDGWTPSINVIDIPVATLIQNPDLIYLTRVRGQVRSVTLHDGRALIIGNDGTAEVFDPATGTSTATGPMVTARNDATVTLLNEDDGRVLIVGGSNYTNPTNPYLASAEIFNPNDATFTPADTLTGAAGRMAQPRTMHAAVLLADGRVLISGGFTVTPPNNFITPSQGAEIFDPESSTFSAAGSMLTARYLHQMTRLSDDRILVTGGFGPSPSNSAEIYDPTATTSVATVPMMSGRGNHTATLLTDGTVLIAGGSTNNGFSLAANGEIYTLATESTMATFTDAGALISPRTRHTATRLADGSVLLTGGLQAVSSIQPPWATAERYVPGTGFIGAPSLLVPRYDHGAALLEDGRIVISAGYGVFGWGSQQTGRTAELYDPGISATGTPSVANPNLPDGSFGKVYGPVTLLGIGGTGAYSFSIVAPTTLPPGLTLTGATIGGRPTAAGLHFFDVRVTDSLGHSGSQTLHIGISILTITTTSLPPAHVGQPYTATLTATGVGDTTWSLVAGLLPIGSPAFDVNADGTITGTPTQTGSFFFTVRAVDSAGQVATAFVSMQVNQPLIITTTSLPAGNVTWGWGQCVNWTGGSWPFTLSIVEGPAALPPGVILDPNSGCLNATTLKATGQTTFTVKVTDSASPPQVATQVLTMRVGASDQNFASWDKDQPTLSIGDGHVVAQTFRQGMTGHLIAVWAPVACTPAAPGTNLTVEIRAVDGLGRPTGTTFATQNFDVNTLPEFLLPFGPYQRVFTFANPAFVSLDVRVAAVFRSATGQCAITEEKPVAPNGFDYLSGDAFQGDGTTWTALRKVDASRPDLPIGTTVDPDRPVDFMQIGRSGHTSTLLVSGKVLLAGGTWFGSTAQLFTPSLHQFAPTTHEMMARRQYHTATTLKTGGLVLIVGGRDPNTQVALDTAELFNPETGEFRAIGATLSTGRFYHTATLLDDGRVLIAGGETDWNAQLSSTEIYTYDAASGGSFTSGPSMHASRAEHSATLLQSGDVLVVGGFGISVDNVKAERYVYVFGSPGSFMATRGQPSFLYRGAHTATRLASDKILIAGGWGNGTVTSTAEVYDQTADSFDPTTGGLLVPSQHHTATRLDCPSDLECTWSGKVLIAGGDDGSGNSLARLELYNPVSGTFSTANALTIPRSTHSATRLPDGKVLLAGGYGQSSASWNSGERFDPAAVIVGIANPNLPDGFTGHTYGPVTLNGTGGASSTYNFTLIAGTLPPDLEFDNGTISGMPSASGTYYFGVSVSDGLGHGTNQTLRIRIDALDITTTSLPTAHINVPYEVPLVATGVGAISWSVSSGSLPPGLAIVGTAIKGTPTGTGFYNVTLKAQDGIEQVAFRSYNVQVNTPLVITTRALTAGNVTWGSGQCVTWMGGSGPITWSIVEGPAALPPGITLNPSNGCLDGTFEATGQTTFTVRVTDSDSPPQVATQVLTMRIGASDQNFASWDKDQPTLSIGDGHVVAQTFRQGMTGHLIAVWAPVACTPAAPGTNLTVEIRAVDGLGRPTGTTFATQNFDVNTLPEFLLPFGPYQRVFTFANPVFLSLDVRVAAVFRSATGQCAITEEKPVAPNGFDYPSGDAFQGDGTTWTALREDDALRPDLPIGTTVDPDRPVDFMQIGRSGHTSTLLVSGKVLLAGGTWFGSTAQLFTPSLHQFAPTTHEMMARRQYHTATTLKTGGLVLIVGGRDPNTQVALNTAELFNPETGEFTSISATLSTGRFYHTATRLDDGRVLIAGGETDWNAQLSTTEIYDPLTFSFSSGPEMQASRAEHTATLLQSGDVLVVGGWGNQGRGIKAERYVYVFGNPGSFVATRGQPSLYRATHTATRLDCPSANLECTWSGKVLIAGGNDESGASIARLELYDPASGTFSTANALTIPRSTHSATRLPDGKVLLAGGYGQSSASWNSGERFDPAAVIVGIANPNLPDGFNDHDYGSVTLSGTGGTPPYHFTLIAGTLPPGLEFNNGTISATPSASGTYYFGVSVSDGLGYGTNQTLRIRIE